MTTERIIRRLLEARDALEAELEDVPPENEAQLVVLLNHLASWQHTLLEQAHALLEGGSPAAYDGLDTRHDLDDWSTAPEYEPTPDLRAARRRFQEAHSTMIQRLGELTEEELLQERVVDGRRDTVASLLISQVEHDLEHAVDVKLLTTRHAGRAKGTSD